MTANDCCRYRKKIMLAPLVLSEEQCGVSDTDLVDVMRFDLAAEPVLAFRFCPWCGVPRVYTPDAEPPAVPPLAPMPDGDEPGSEY